MCISSNKMYLLYITVYICNVIIKQLKIMRNLLNILSQDLQNKMSEYKVSFVGLDDYNELIVKREYDWDYSFFTAIENELRNKGFEVC